LVRDLFRHAEEEKGKEGKGAATWAPPVSERRRGTRSSAKQGERGGEHTRSWAEPREERGKEESGPRGERGVLGLRARMRGEKGFVVFFYFPFFYSKAISSPF